MSEINDLSEFADLFISKNPHAGVQWEPECACWICHDHLASEIHHIAGRNHNLLKNHRCNLAALCSRCHSEGVAAIRPEGMFFIKSIRDPDGFTKPTMRDLLRAKGLGNGRVAS